MALEGQPDLPEIAQDFVGFRGLATQTASYPILGVALRTLGIDWNLDHRTTHPPTAFLFVAPFAFLPLNLGTSTWAWLMVALLFFTLVCYGLSWRVAFGLTPILILWPPLALSLEQLTIIWMLGIAIGYRLADKRGFWAGAGIAFASLTKLLPALMMVIFLFRKQWSAVVGFFSVCIGAFLALIVLNPSSLFEYIQTNSTNSALMIARPDNSALVINVLRSGNPLVIIIAVCGFASLLLITRSQLGEGKQNAQRQWLVLNFLCVALLPISWIYSIAPLLPIILFLLARRKLSTTFTALCAIAIPCVIPPWGPATVLPLILVTALAGLGLIFDALPWRLFSATTLKALTS